MDFRQYDNALGRFLCIDALSEKNHYLSPYNFADANPVFFNDPSGLDSGMPSWLQEIWNNSGSGVTTWTNIGGAFESNKGDIVSYLSIDAGGSGGGGGGAGSGGGPTFGSMEQLENYIWNTIIANSSASKFYKSNNSDGSVTVTWWESFSYSTKTTFEGNEVSEVVVGLKKMSETLYIGDGFSVLSNNDWISQFSQPRPNVACKRTCDLIAGVSSLSNSIQMTIERNGALVPTSNFQRGLNTINNYLSAKRPITVGFDYKNGTTTNADRTTDHYIVIMGRGSDNGKSFYNYFEVGTRHLSTGTSPLNRLYINNNSISGFTPSGTKFYTVSQVRPIN